MSLFDQIILAEPIPCLACGSTAEDKLQEMETETELQGLKIIRIHDGKGGLKDFQTKDLSMTFSDYRFPGFVPFEELFSGNEDLYGKNRKRFSSGTIDGIEICNLCEERFEGDFTLERTGDIYLMRKLAIRFDECWKADVPSLATMEFAKGRDEIVLFPLDDKAVEFYNNTASRENELGEHYRNFAKKIKDPVRQEEIMACLETRLSSGKRLYRHPLADACVSLEWAKDKAAYCRGALEAMLAILYHDNPGKAGNLFELANLGTKEGFSEDYEALYSWFFTGEKTIGSMVGSLRGANYFLHQLKTSKS